MSKLTNTLKIQGAEVLPDKKYFGFVFFNPDLEDLVVEEMQNRFPTAKASMKKKGFISYKFDSLEKFKEFYKTHFVFALMSGEVLFLAKPQNVLEKVNSDFRSLAHLESVQIPQVSRENLISALQQNSLIPELENKPFYYFIFNLDDKNSAFCNIQGSPFKGVGPLLEADPISRAYYKIREAMIKSRQKLTKEQKIIEVGASPGGAGQFILSSGCQYLAIDAAEMSPIIDKSLDVLDQWRYQHLKKSIFQCNEDDLKTWLQGIQNTGVLNKKREGVDWLIFDMNVPPEITLAAFKRLGRLISPYLPLGVVMTLKLRSEGGSPEELSLEWSGVVSYLKRKGFYIKLLQSLWWNKRELMLVATRPGKTRKKED